MYNRAIDVCLCYFESAGDILVSGEAVRGIWYDRCYFGRQTCNNNNNNTFIYIAPACRMTSEALNQGGSDPSTQFMVLLVWYIIFSVIYHHSPSFSVVGAVRVKMDRLPPESQEQLKKTGNDRLRAKLMKAGYDEAQVEDMGRKELLDTMAKVTVNEDLMQEASQAPLPADETSSWTYEAGMEAARLRELEMEERKAVREA